MQYISEIEIKGNSDCTRMFCYSLKAECNLKDGGRENYTVTCLAIKKPDGSYTCPKATACAISKTPEYDEYQDNLPNDIVVKETFFNNKCNGSVTWEQGGIKL